MPSTKPSLWHMDSEVYLLTGGFVLGMAVSTPTPYNRHEEGRSKHHSDRYPDGCRER